MKNDYSIPQYEATNKNKYSREKCQEESSVTLKDGRLLELLPTRRQPENEQLKTQFAQMTVSTS